MRLCFIYQVAFVSGGLIPPARRGSKLAGMMHEADWYFTITVGLAGLSVPAPGNIYANASEIQTGWSPRSERPFER
jgi:hypothetical protein